jgi:hypothetical protein
MHAFQSTVLQIGSSWTAHTLDAMHGMPSLTYSASDLFRLKTNYTVLISVSPTCKLPFATLAGHCIACLALKGITAHCFIKRGLTNAVESHPSTFNLCGSCSEGPLLAMLHLHVGPSKMFVCDLHQVFVNAETCV